MDFGFITMALLLLRFLAAFVHKWINPKPLHEAYPSSIFRGERVNQTGGKEGGSKESFTIFA
jgi:hypothetical protein